MADLTAAALSSLLATQQATEAQEAARNLYIEQQEAHTVFHRETIAQSTRHQTDWAELRRNLFDHSTFQQDALALKEAMRDLWQQKNEICQIRMFIATLLFGCCFASISDGLPQISFDASSSSSSSNGDGISTTTTTLFAIFVSSGNFILLASIFLTMLLYRRLSKYDVDHPLRRYSLCGHTHQMFEGFFDCQCSRLDVWSIRLLYIGIADTFAGAISLQFLKYDVVYGDKWGIGGVLLGTILLGLAIVTASHVYFSDGTRAPEGAAAIKVKRSIVTNAAQFPEWPDEPNDDENRSAEV